ncbi:MAG: hypothetical protein HY876_08390 [Coriobacteriales bacterium]|nr:hypothetical protein [Coriobacteriales bacterium]
MIHHSDIHSERIAQPEEREPFVFDARPVVLVVIVLALCAGVIAYVQRQVSAANTRLAQVEAELARSGGAPSTGATATVASPAAEDSSRYLGRFSRIEEDDGVLIVHFFPGQLLTGKTAASVAASNGDTTEEGVYVLGHHGRTDTLYAAKGTPVRMRTPSGWTSVTLAEVADRLEADSELSRRYMWFAVEEGFVTDVREADIAPLTDANSSERASR